MASADQNVQRESEALLDRLSNAIAAGDADAVVAEFWPAAEVSMFGSEGPETAYGPEEIAALWRRVLSRGQTYIWRWREQRAVAAGSVAWLTAEATVTIRDAADSRDVEYRVSLVLVNEAGSWMIAQYHGSEPATPW